ncbi:peptidase S8 and S53 subtilisin kexin sedolisin [Hymenobacter roseosalivarius DSM 11622]|uniref:Peptidase S8 and S53 subtilisin kexin sedolisin n=1 Tax=Hymenobacter roseosalivarius DSM 11622 TaxID=645990 RepID=A0A1W1W4I7_9BACT|nr:S8 family serine peptidase [Hymenobacter roseosalivarius]SMC00529.1 peptidase S8 and S53 subtilisin kexin sedolisin [Hymenobacter roseosalivarius DSM 11622]
MSASLVAASAVFTACSDNAIDASDPSVAQISADAKAADDLIEGQYIVVLKDGSVDTDSEGSYDAKANKVKGVGQGILKGRGMKAEKVGRAYGHALKGFVAELTPAEAAELRQDGRVAYVEQDRIISLGKPVSGGSTTQPAQTTPYGITRVGSADGSATGRTAWVIDTGIDLDHPDLKVDLGRSKSFLSATSGKGYASADDGNGHGTHVSGTIAALNNSIGVVGVAAGATVVAVRVLDSRGSGSNSGVIAGVDYVGANGAPGDVANMSLGGGVSTALDQAVLNASQGGVLFALAAGNETDNANNHSPARVNGANIYTISAMDNTDTWASFSNFGNPPVDYCMPGVSIQSTWLNGGYNTISGTSMATPHMAGVLLMRGKNFTALDAVKSDPDGNADPIAHL